MSETSKAVSVNLLLLVPGLLIVSFSFTIVTLTLDYTPLFLATVWAGGVYCGFLWLLPILFPGKLRDERVILLHKDAVLTAFSVSWLCLVSVAVLVCSYVGPGGSIPAAFFIALIFGWSAIFILVLTLASLFQNGWRHKGG